MIINFIMLFYNGVAQPVSDKNIRFNHFSDEHNLPQTMINAIIQDPKGYMWFGTNNGIVKYDGYTFTTYQHNLSDKNSLPDNMVGNLCADNEGNIWYLGGDATVNYFSVRTEKFISFPQDKKNKSPSNGINTDFMTLAADGTLWFSAGDKGIYTYQPNSKKFIHQLDLPTDSCCDNNAYFIMFDKKGLLWIASRSCLYSYQTKTKKLSLAFHATKKIPFGSYIQTMIEDRAGMLWLSAAGEGVIRYNPSTNQTVSYKHIEGDSSSLSDNYIMSIFEDRDGTVWFGGYSVALSRYRPKTNNFFTIHANLADEHGLGAENVLSIFQDRSGMLWVGTNGGGINTVNLVEKKFHAWQNYDNDYKTNHPLCITKDHEGKIWIGTFQRGIYLFNPATTNFTAYNFLNLTGADRAFNNVMGLCEDSYNTFWFAGTFEGLHYLNRQTGKFTTVHSFRDNPDSTSFVISGPIIEDKNKRLWVGTTNGLKCYNLETKTYSGFEKIFPDTNNLAANNISTLYFDDDSLLWIGGDGLTILNTKTGKAKIFKHDNGNQHSISFNAINCFYDDHKGKIFIGTDCGGLNVFDKKSERFICYTVKDGLPDNNVKAILAEDANTLWLSTNNGICKIIFKNCKDEKPTVVCRNYNTSDGLPSNESEGGTVIGDDGTFYFCTNAGLVAFKPDELKDNAYIPPVVITSLQVLNSNISVGDTTGILKLPVDETKVITLSYLQNIFSFSFAALSYVHPEKNKFAYMLENFDKNWIYTDASKRFATYTNLNAGTYIFKVKASNNDGVWNENPTSVKIIITPPYWQTWWFRLAMAASVAAAVYGLYKYRLQQVIKLQSIRNNIASDLHDDIGSTLNSISVLSEVAKQQAGKPLPALDEVGASSRKIVEAMSDIVWTINPENDNFEKIIIRMRSFAHQLLKGKKIEFRFHVAGDFKKIKMPMQARKNIYLIFKEATTNIAKYSEATHVNFSVTQNNKMVSLVIRDNGIGFDRSKIESGNGIKNMQRRADEIRATIKIESVTDSGTHIELNLET